MNEWKEYFPILQWFGTVVVAIIANYIALTYKVKQVTNNLNGLGGKINKVTDSQNETGKSVSRIEGYLEAFTEKPYKSKSKSGHA